MDRRAFRYILPYWRRLGGVLAISLASTALSLWLPYLTKVLVDEALVARSLDALRQTVWLFLAAGAAGFALSVASGLLYTRISAEILFDMRRDLYQHLQRLSPRFYAATRLGDIVSRINNDIGEIQRVAAETALAWFGNVLFLAGSVAILVWLDWRLFLATAAALPPAAWALMRYRRRIEARTTDLRERSADIGSFLIDTLQGMRAVVTSAAETREVTRFSRLNDAFIATLDGRAAHALPGRRTAVAVPVGGHRRGLLLWRLASRRGHAHAGDPRGVHGVSGARGRAGPGPPRVVRRAGDREGLMAPGGGAARHDAGSRRTPGRSGARWLVRGDVEFDDVTLSHGRGQPVLDRVSFRVSAGQTLAIVGASGSGKSTIGDLVVRLLDPDAGVVRLDGVDLRALRLADLRRQVQIVDQDPVLFHATIEDNILYARPDASSDDVRMALEAAGLTDFIARLPEGLRTMVGDRGLALSAGERQRVALARSFLAQPSVLVLDEPSASLDPVAERQVIEGYRRVMRGRTTLLISHRLELVRSADQVILIEGARVVDRGTPAALEAGVGPFASLFRGDRPNGVPVP